MFCRASTELLYLEGWEQNAAVEFEKRAGGTENLKAQSDFTQLLFTRLKLACDIFKKALKQRFALEGSLCIQSISLLIYNYLLQSSCSQVWI